MNRHILITCDNCGCILKSSQQTCIRCGHELRDYERRQSSSGGKTAFSMAAQREYTYHMADESDDNEDDDDRPADDNYGFTEVVTAAPLTVRELLKTYSDTLEQLKGEKCMFFSVLYNPKSGRTMAHHVGFPDDVVKSMKDTAEKCIPKSTREKRYLKFQKNMSEAERLALPHGCPHPGCEYRTKYGWHIKHHMRTHTGEKPYACDKCDFTCADPSHMPTHKRRHENVTDYQCPVCFTYWEHQRGLESHITFSHKLKDASRSTKCLPCDKSFRNRLELLRHEKNLHKDENIKCDYEGCVYEAKQLIQVAKHKKFHHQGSYDGKKIPCPYCPFRSDSYFGINTHIKKCHKRQPVSKIENAAVENAAVDGPSSESNSHIVVSKKKGRKVWQCYYCDNEQPSWEKYHKHLKSHDHTTEKILIRSEKTADGVEKFYCARCKHFKNENREVIEKHVERCQRRCKGQVVKRPKKYMCAQCDYAAEVVKPLIAHYALFHENSTVEYKCPKPDCGLIFTNVEGIKKHRVTGRCTASNPALVPPATQGTWQNRKNRHKFEFKCDQCPFSAPTELKLNHHKSFHKGECFQCSWCGLVFYDNNQFMLHEKRHKREDLQKTTQPKLFQGKSHIAGVQLLSLTNQSAGAIKNKYRGYQVIKLITTPQADLSHPDGLSLSSVTGQSTETVTTSSAAATSDPEPTDTVTNKDTVTDVSEHKSISLLKKNHALTKPTSVPVPTVFQPSPGMVFMPTLVSSIDPATGNQVPGAIVYKPVGDVVNADASAKKDEESTSPVDNPTQNNKPNSVNKANPINKDTGDIARYRKILPGPRTEEATLILQSTIAGVQKLTPDGQKAVRNQVAAVLNKSDGKNGKKKRDKDELKEKKRASRQRKQAPKLAQLLDSRIKSKHQKKTTAIGTMCKDESAGEKTAITKDNDPIKSFLKRVNNPNVDCKKIAESVDVKELMKTLNVKPGTKMLLKKAEGSSKLAVVPGERQLKLTDSQADTTGKKSTATPCDGELGTNTGSDNKKKMSITHRSFRGINASFTPAVFVSREVTATKRASTETTPDESESKIVVSKKQKMCIKKPILIKPDDKPGSITKSEKKQGYVISSVKSETSPAVVTKPSSKISARPTTLSNATTSSRAPVVWKFAATGYKGMLPPKVVLNRKSVETSFAIADGVKETFSSGAINDKSSGDSEMPALSLAAETTAQNVMKADEEVDIVAEINKMDTAVQIDDLDADSKQQFLVS